MSLLAEIQALIQPEAAQQAFLQRTQAAVVPEDFARIAALEQLLVRAHEALLQNQQSSAKLRRVLFGPKTEKTRQLFPPAEPPPAEPKPKRRGHGRRGTKEYTGARRVPVCHPNLQAGQKCPDCERGKLCQLPPAVTPLLEGSSPVTARLFEAERFRCASCGKVFTAPLPPEAGTEKYDVSVGPTVALLRYGCGLPHYRLARLQESLGVPLPESTQWEVMLPNAEAAGPALQELIRQGAQGSLVYVLSLIHI